MKFTYLHWSAPYLVSELHQTSPDTCHETLMMTYLISPPVSAILILRLDVEHVLHVELEGLGAPGPHNA